jgi:hypothetical protein
MLTFACSDAFLHSLYILAMSEVRTKDDIQPVDIKKYAISSMANDSLSE